MKKNENGQNCGRVEYNLPLFVVKNTHLLFVSNNSMHSLQKISSLLLLILSVFRLFITIFFEVGFV